MGPNPTDACEGEIGSHACEYLLMRELHQLNGCRPTCGIRGVGQCNGLGLDVDDIDPDDMTGSCGPCDDPNSEDRTG